MIALHVGLRYLRRRRAAWLALAAITLTVAVPVVVIGVVQGFLDVTIRQTRANESDLTASAPWSASGLPEDGRAHRAVAADPGIRAAAPFITRYGLLIPQGEGGVAQSAPCQVDGIDWAGDSAIGRLSPGMLHPPPVLNLSAPPLPPEQRGSGFLTAQWRAHLALSGLDLASAMGCGVIPPPPRMRPAIGVVVGREVLYGSGIPLGMPVKVSAGDGPPINAEISDTIGTGVLEIDRFAVLMPLGHAQVMTGMAGRGGSAKRVAGWRLGVAPDQALKPLARRLQGATGLRVETWQERRGNVVRSLELQRNILGLVMVAIQAIAVFIVYAVFSTLVAEKRQDIGVLLGLGARRSDIAGIFLVAGLAACVVGSLLGWALGWGALAVLNPLSRLLDMPLFPQDVIYTPEAPTSYDPRIPLFFAGVMTLIGLVAVALPAWRASRVDPVEVLRS